MHKFKLISFVLLGLLLINLASAGLIFDQAKTYDPQTKTISINNQFLGITTSKVADIQLTSEENMNCFGNYCYAEIEINNNKETKFIDQFEFYKVIGNNLGVKLNKETRVLIYNSDLERIISHNTYGKELCEIIKGNETETCIKPLLKTDYETEYGDWEEYDINNNLPIGNYKIRIYIDDIGNGEKVEWIPTLYGQRITEWTTFTGATMFENQLQNTTDFDESKPGTPTWLAQSFTIGTNASNISFSLLGVELLVEKSAGCDLGEVLMVSIHNASNSDSNLPDSALILSTNKTIACGIIENETASGGIGYSAFNITLPSVTLHPGVKYVLNATMTGSGVDLHWRQYNNTNGDSYRGGNSSNTLTVDQKDFWFAVYGFNPLSSLNIKLNNPGNNSIQYNDSLIFNSSTTFTNFNITNATFSLYNVNGTLFSRQINTTLNGVYNDTLFSLSNIQLGSYLWNVYYCAVNTTNTFCNSSNYNFTFNYGGNKKWEFFNNQTSTITSEKFYINYTIPSSISAINGYLTYNNTNYTGIKTQSGNNLSLVATVDIPYILTQQNKTFFWNIQLIQLGVTNFSTTLVNNQSILPFFIDNCTTNTQLVLNYTLKDEDNQQFLSPGLSYNTSIQLAMTISSLVNTNISIPFNMSYNVSNPVQVCINVNSLNTTNYRLDSQVRYSSLNREVEFYNTQDYILNNNTIPININLYDLLTTNSQEFKIILKDANFLPLPNAVIEVNRKYIAESVFKVVEAPLIDINGQTIAHLVLSDEIYTFVVKKEGVILGIISNQLATCTDVSSGQCTIEINLANPSSSPTNFYQANNILSSMNFTVATRTANAYYIIPNGQNALVSINGTLFDSKGNTSVCGQQITSSSASLSCIVPQQYGNATFQMILYKDGQEVQNILFPIASKPSDNYPSGLGILLAIGLYCTLILFFIGEPLIIIVAGIIGLGLSISIGFISGGSLYGSGAIILWFVFAGGIILWQISKAINK